MSGFDMIETKKVAASEVGTLTMDDLRGEQKERCPLLNFQPCYVKPCYVKPCYATSSTHPNFNSHHTHIHTTQTLRATFHWTGHE